MKYLSSNEIRKMWLDFFKSKDHTQIPSASLIPINDPTLLWINSGVAALKQYFDGSKVPTNKRLTNVQKSIRTNDIENVGNTSRHHTFFEMLGNFSIGDYFRKEAIEYAFEILTSPKYFALPLDKLYFTYHPSDKETYECWLSHGVKEDHLIPLEGNFWEIGEGPCGPNTEVFFDRGEKYDFDKKGIELLKQDIENDRYLEIWGIVFSQYNAKDGVPRSEYEELPSKNIDTGAGLERIACILQNADSNFETDLFSGIIRKTEEITGKKYEDDKAAFRVIADHIRATTFALSDGALFANDGRGYVLRRLVRRAMRYGRKLGVEEPFLKDLVDPVVEIYKDFYPEIATNKEKVKKLIENEEKRFLKTLKIGEALVYKIIENSGMITSEVAFKLYDTYGFPLDITKEIAKEENIVLELDKFEELLEEQRERARKARSKEDSMHVQSSDLLAFTKESKFCYDSFSKKAKVIGTFVDGKKVEEITDEGEIIVDVTPFYAEAGGQISDVGTLFSDDVLGEIDDVSKAPHDEHLHHVKLHYGTLKVGDVVTLKIEETRRKLIMRNHSATHLLQRALRDVLGESVTQQGSFVSDKYLRFDFNYEEGLSESVLNEVEEKVNEYIALGLPQITEILPLEEAKKRGAIAEFSEKYEDIVRVVGFGDVSLELCGGTHVKNTEDIGLFVILSEHSVAAGIRRIEATTSLNAYKEVKHREKLAHYLRLFLKAKTLQEALQLAKQLKETNDELKAKLEAFNRKKVSEYAKTLDVAFKEINDISLLVKFVEGGNRDFLVNLADELKAKDPSRVIVLIGEEDEKLPLIVTLGKEAIKKGYKAGDIMRKVAKHLEGSGGGNPSFAQGQGKNRDKIKTLEDYVIKEVLNG
ncbi:MAG: alanine--tRNA ligase [Bacilli bacterium]|jgi:alanyl-tRNA synthetase